MVTVPPDEYPSLILNELILSKFDKICEDCGFKGKHVSNREAYEKLLGTNLFYREKHMALKHLLWEYGNYVKRHVSNEDDFFKKAQKILEKDQILQGFFESNKLDPDEQIFCMLTFSMFYFFLKEKDIEIEIYSKFETNRK